MTPDVTWLNIEISHVKPIALFDVPNIDELKEAFNWIDIQPLLKIFQQQNGNKWIS